MFRDALGVAGLTPEIARYDTELLTVYAQGEFAAEFFAITHSDPWRTPFFMDMNRRMLASSGTDPLGTISTLSRMTGKGSRRSLLASPIVNAEKLAAEPDSLRKVLERYKTEGLATDDLPSKIDAPKEVQQAAALLLYQALDSVRFRRAAFAQVDDLDEAYDRETTIQPTDDDPQVHQELVSFYRLVEMNYMYAAAQDMAAAVTKAQDMVKSVPSTTRYGFAYNTLWGLVALGGGGDSRHGGDDTFLVVDTGGDDVYVGGPSNDSVSNWLSINIDTDGNDQYLSDIGLEVQKVSSWSDRKAGRAKPGLASATFGLSFLFDSKGDDLYRTHRSGLGSASFGVAYLRDVSGTDVYEAYADGQGYGKFGIGVLEDLAGNDKYFGFTQVQGCGLAGGVGALIDRGGNDVYSANDAVIDFPSPQSDKHNVSMAQGAGYGIRSDYLTGHSLSGGLGLLYDQGGDDAYDCGVFGQGTGYWEGVGMLWDDAGKDTYHGMWYVQGAAAHFAIGYLEDLAGDDKYHAEMNMAQGAGHDFSTGTLIDRGGKDSYRAPNLSLGAGNANGIGVFVDAGGDDAFESSGVTLGKAAESTVGSMRERAICLGVFIDLDGKDTYPAGSIWAKDGARIANWTAQRPTPREGQVGVFWDSR